MTPRLAAWPPALIVVQPEVFSAELLPQDTVLFRRVIHRIPLLVT